MPEVQATVHCPLIDRLIYLILTRLLINQLIILWKIPNHYNMSRVFHRATFNCCSYRMCKIFVMIGAFIEKIIHVQQSFWSLCRLQSQSWIKNSHWWTKCPISKNKPKKSSLNESFLSWWVSFTSQIIICTFSREKRSLSLLESI